MNKYIWPWLFSSVMPRGTKPNGSISPEDTTNDTGLPDALKTPNRRDLLKTLGIAGVASLAGCLDQSPGGNGNGEGKKSGQFTEARSTAAGTLNWIYNTEEGSDERINLTLDGAWQVTTDNEVFPLWCTPETEDSKTYTITVRDGLEWGGDYGQMTADDWVYMINEVLKPKWAAYPNRTDWVDRKVTKTGKMTFDVTLPKKDPAWPLRPVMWGQYCAPKGLLEKYVKMAKSGKKKQAQKQLEEQDKELTELTYTGNLGPYTKETWEPEAKFVAKRNENYYMRDRDDVDEIWKKAPYYDTYTMRVIPEQSSRLQALERGEAHYAAIPPNRGKQYQENEAVDVYVQPQPYLRILIFNMRANGWKPFRLKEIRQTFMMAVNKKTFAKNVFSGFAQPAHTMQPSWSDWYDDSKVTTFGTGDLYSVNKAKQKITQALSNSQYNARYDGNTLVDGDGNQVQLKFIAQAGQPTEQTMAEVLKKSLEKIGVKVNIKKVQGKTFLDKYAKTNVPKGKQSQVPKGWPPSPQNSGPRDIATSESSWDMALIYKFNTYPRTPSDSKVFFHERGSINFYGYVPSKGVNIKKMYENAATTVDEKKRKSQFAEIFGVISEEQPFGFLVMDDDIVGYEKGIEGPVEKFGSGWNDQTFYRG